MINDDRMSNILLGGAKIFRLPAHDEQQGEAYLTNPFPVWKLCVNRQRHMQTAQRNEYVLYKSANCPLNCPGGSNQQAIRFVQACRNGHMDEIDWAYVIHRRRNAHDPEPSHYFYNPGNGTVPSITVTCSACNGHFSMSDPQFGYYSDRIRCSARMPQSERAGQTKPTREYDCDEPMKMTQRRAANLRVAVSKTLLKLETVLSVLHKNLSSRSIRGQLVPSIRPKNKTEFENRLDELLRDGQIDPITRNEILNATWEEIEEGIAAVTAPSAQALGYNWLILDEFKKLMEGSTDGIPPHMTSSGETVCEMVSEAREIHSAEGHTFRICPVQMLTTITVQTGFRREISASNTGNITTPPELVEYHDSFEDENGKSKVWLPGIEYTGEGIFIRLDSDDGWHQQLGGQSFDSWSNAFNDSGRYNEHLFRDPHARVEMHPVFVWWHTLSHLLIRAIGEDAGYSSASIRERVYFELDEDTGRARGGILLYSTMPGAEGSMGGLIALVPYFDRMLRIAFDQLQVCSGDPLCFENKFLHNTNASNVNGAACYGCTMNSETSCEHRNMWLDRRVITGD